MSSVATEALPARRAYHDHIVDTLIAERAPKLSGGVAWPLIRPLLYRLLDYRKARTMADDIAQMSGRQALEHVSALLDVKVSVRGLERIPTHGRVVLICNHPTGIADGIAVYDAVKGLRPDLCFYANADAHRVSPAFSEVLIPVEWVEAKRTRERTRLTLNLTREAMEAERALAIFPAGRLARKAPDGTLMDPPWMPSAFSIARKYEAPIVPMHLAGPWSTLFHFFNDFSGELRDITLFHELLNKRGRAFDLTVGLPIAPAHLDPDVNLATLAVKDYIARVLPHHPDRPFA
ncbi:MAG: 1-acyl-sn-glycerol-3-phosphate acyltransferase [Phenylobacterium sp.]|uniref:GNAT family N-acetyltransferase n=1 Tax=Phenylobacterium sp. TaxID=1871053 RepID=UPI001B704E69|nr:1-acyl-sn-glycerol-3-phosphate acyltransferase [Phenylobacterium sp.]MBP7650188.1 1-acyl-sn-glycerol-3-phosphate acyltransferase [Phenylobacterium sp.]MBP7816644.1 1-acyl-sn-glycerol-3-phosphate acyltransferase [Phenylobacterium sp.]MBP9232325.1 1-acyl-sn-glycerol-3-phosphate acyltransferase [Phenylobacterium sp.]